MSSAITMPTQTAAFRAIQLADQRLSTVDMVEANVAEHSPAPRSTKPSNTANSLQKAQQQATLRAKVEPEEADVSQTFYEWLSAVRELQKDPWERKKTIISFVMLVYHTGVEDGEPNGDSLTKEKLDIISKAPGWNENEHKILTLMKDHFYTIKGLSGSNEAGITYADLQSLFSSKTKLRDAQRVSASNRAAKAGCSVGLCIQILLMVAAFQFCLGVSFALAVVGGLAGLVMQQNGDGALKTGLAGALWGITAGSAISAALAANQAAFYFDNNLEQRVDYLRQDIKALRFE